MALGPVKLRMTLRKIEKLRELEKSKMRKINLKKRKMKIKIKKKQMNKN